MWTAKDDPLPQEVMSAGLLGIALRTTSAHSLCSIDDGMLKPGLTSVILGANPGSEQLVEQGSLPRTECTASFGKWASINLGIQPAAGRNNPSFLPLSSQSDELLKLRTQLLQPLPQRRPRPWNLQPPQTRHTNGLDLGRVARIRGNKHHRERSLWHARQSRPWSPPRHSRGGGTCNQPY